MSLVSYASKITSAKHGLHVRRLGHFRVAPCLCFKTSLALKNIDMKIRVTYKFIFTPIQIISIGKVFHENSFEKGHKG